MKHVLVHLQMLDMKIHNLNVFPGTIFGGFKILYALYLQPLYKAMIAELQHDLYTSTS
jgi:hypothetical protein